MLTQLPKISIVTPSFNQAGFIEQTIQSVLEQGYPNLEYIVMDGGSTDGTIEILKKYENHLFWISQKDRGQSHAINKGLQLATGEIFAYLNSDDLYEPGALVKVGEFFAKNPKASWLTGRCHIIDHNGKEIRKFVTLYKNFWLTFHYYRILLVLNYISQPATFWRKDALSKTGVFDESLGFTMDYDYSLRVGQRYKLWIHKDYLASFRVHPHAKSRSFHEHFQSDLEVTRKYATSPLLIVLHEHHNALIINAYEHMSVKESDAAGEAVFGAGHESPRVADNSILVEN